MAPQPHSWKDEHEYNSEVNYSLKIKLMGVIFHLVKCTKQEAIIDVCGVNYF